MPQENLPGVDIKLLSGPRQVIIITGSVGCGKTSLVEKAAHLLKTEGVSVAGLIAPRLGEAEEQRGYIVHDLRTGKERVLARTTPFNTPLRQGSFYFDEESFYWAEELVSRSLNSQVLILDEVGRLELRGNGYCRLMQTTLRHYRGCFIFTARREILKQLSRFFKIQRVEVIDVEIEENSLLRLKELVKAVLN